MDAIYASQVVIEFAFVFALHFLLSILHPHAHNRTGIATSACLLLFFIISRKVSWNFVSLPQPSATGEQWNISATINSLAVKWKDREDRERVEATIRRKFSRKVKRISVNYRDFASSSCRRYRFPDTWTRRNRSVDVRNKFAVCVVADEGCRRPLPADKKGDARWPDILFTLETPILCNRWRPRVLARTPSFRPSPRLPCFSMFIYSPRLTLLKSCFLYGCTFDHSVNRPNFSHRGGK